MSDERALIAGMLAGGTLMFVALTREVADGGERLTGLDARLLAEVTGRRRDRVTPFVRTLTHLGTTPAVHLALAGAGTVAQRRTGSWSPYAQAATALAAGQAVRLVSNRVLDRHRPPRDGWLARPRGPSFPSGHTTNATLGYGLAAALLVHGRTPGTAPVAATRLSAVMVASAVGVSRVYLGVHWPSDVAGGWSLGAACLALAARAVHREASTVSASSVPTSVTKTGV